MPGPAHAGNESRVGTSKSRRARHQFWGGALRAKGLVTASYATASYAAYATATYAACATATYAYADI
jgi:hypothetical protein